METLRIKIRKIISEYYNNQVVYPETPDRFPKFDGTNTTPSDLDGEFDSEFNAENEIGENESFDTEKNSKDFINKEK